MEGEDADRAAYDIAAFWSRSGIAHLLTRPARTRRSSAVGWVITMPASPAPPPCAQRSTAEKTGEGQLVSTSLLREGLYTISFDLSVLLVGPHAPDRPARSMGNVAMNNYSASDGKRFWVVGLDGMRHWPRSHGRWGAKTGSTTSVTPIPATGPNAAEIIAQLDEIFATKTMAEWEEVFATEPDFFWAPVNSPDDLLADPQFYASGALVECPTARAPRT